MIYLITTIAAVALLLLLLLMREFSKTREYSKLIERIAALAGGKATGQPVYTYKLLRDLIERKDKELEDIGSHLEYSQSIIDNLGEALIITDSDGMVEYANSAAIQLSRKSEVVGKKITEAIDNFYIADLLEETISSRETQQSEVTMYYPERSFHDCRIIRVAFEEENDRYLVLLRDITREKEVELMRRDFVANASHELRTPLTSIHGYAETLLEDEHLDRETNRRFLRIIEEESARMTRLINDLLDLEKLESGEAGIRFEDVELARVGEYVLRIVKPLAEESGVELHYDLERDVYVEGDFDRLVQLLLNLSDNAIKNTAIKDHGPKDVWIRAYHSIDDAVLEVEDTGIGIPESARKQLFQRFYRVDKARSRKMGGTGLGLVIARFITEKHGGNISVETEYGSGSIFKARFPLKKVLK